MKLKHRAQLFFNLVFFQVTITCRPKHFIYINGYKMYIPNEFPEGACENEQSSFNSRLLIKCLLQLQVPRKADVFL